MMIVIIIIMIIIISIATVSIIRFDIGLHVDCCLGGFILPFAKSIAIAP
jgi:hypothetical protein